MKWSLKLGRLWGIDVFVHFTFILFLAWFGFEVPAIGFFHPVNALLIFVLILWIVHETWRGGGPAKPAEPPTPAAV